MTCDTRLPSFVDAVTNETTQRCTFLSSSSLHQESQKVHCVDYEALGLSILLVQPMKPCLAFRWKSYIDEHNCIAVCNLTILFGWWMIRKGPRSNTRINYFHLSQPIYRRGGLLGSARRLTGSARFLGVRLGIDTSKLLHQAQSSWLEPLSRHSRCRTVHILCVLGTASSSAFIGTTHQNVRISLFRR
jgi:hypothetical protein